MSVFLLLRHIAGHELELSEIVSYHKTIYSPSSSLRSINYLANPQDASHKVELAKINESSHTQGESYYMHTSGITEKNQKFWFSH